MQPKVVRRQKLNLTVFVLAFSSQALFFVEIYSKHIKSKNMKISFDCVTFILRFVRLVIEFFLPSSAEGEARERQC